MVPVITKAQIAAENEMMRNIKNPRQMRGLINRWLEDYPKLELGKYNAAVQAAIIAKYEVAERMAAVLNQYELLQPETNFNNDDVSSTTDSGYSASPSSHAFTTPPRVSSIAASSSNPTRPRVSSSARPISPISPIRPIASNPIFPTTPTRWSNSKKMVSRRIIYDSVTTRSSVITKSYPSPHTRLPKFTSSMQAATSTPMRVPALPQATNNGDYTVIGPNGTIVLTTDFNTISFSWPTTATRNLLSLVFSEEVLAKNTLTGKPPLAIRKRGRPPKGLLNPNKVADVIYCITSRTNFTEYDVRCTITTKCADSAKTLRRLSKISESQN